MGAQVARQGTRIDADHDWQMAPWVRLLVRLDQTAGGCTMKVKLDRSHALEKHHAGIR